MSPDARAYRRRLGPIRSGYLHLGHARTFWIAAVVADDHAMRISEVVRGEDLLTSTARQLLLYEALAWLAPAFYHCPLMNDETGTRLAKRKPALSLRALREQGRMPEEIRAWPGFKIQ